MLFYKDRLADMRCKDRNFYSLANVWKLTQDIEKKHNILCLACVFYQFGT